MKNTLPPMPIQITRGCQPLCQRWGESGVRQVGGAQMPSTWHAGSGLMSSRARARRPTKPGPCCRSALNAAAALPRT